LTFKRFHNWCNFRSILEFNHWLTTGVVLVPTALTRQDEDLE